MSTILLTGASGFVGSHVLPTLLEDGHHVRALVRGDASRRTVLERLSDAQRSEVSFAEGDVGETRLLAHAMEGIDAVVHLVAIPRDHAGGRELERVNTEGTRNVLAAMREAGVSRIVHLGALGVRDLPELHYGRSKARAEEAVRGSGLRWTILKPSLMWGERDGFFNIIAALVRMSPGLVPIPARQSSRFQPLWVRDLARVVAIVLADEGSVGQSFELGGPELWTYREMVEEVIRAMGKRRVILPLPLPLVKLVAGTAERLRLPFPVATDQLRQLAHDNATALDSVERAFAFTPRSMRDDLGHLRSKPDRQGGAPS
jgi:uncharacterized protein YbjT (DUF2867 family)